MRKYFVFITILLLMLAGKSSAQNVFNPNDPIVHFNPADHPDTPATNVIGKWVMTPHPANTWNTSAFKAYYFNEIAFRLRYPNSFNATNPTKYPLILFFHGGGEIGPITDNDYHLFVGAKQFEEKMNRGEFNAFMLFPQARFIGWDNFQFSQMNRVIDSLIKYCNVDENRIIVMGISIGGYGTMTYGAFYPKRAAVLMPTSDPFISAAEANIPEFLQIPVWIGNGGLDNNPFPFYVDRFNNLFKSQGGSLRHSLYPNSAHVMWDPQWAEQPNVLTTYWQRAHKANPVVYFDKRQYAPGVPINSTIGITRNYHAYEWQRNGVTIATSTAGSNTIIDPTNIISFTGNTVTVNAAGTYRVRFKWTPTSPFTEWSPWPAYITTNPTARANVFLHGINNLGNNATVTVPTFFVLNGKTSTPPIPEISIVSYQWSKVSGPAQHTISTPNADTTWVDNLVPGTYVFRLKILDNNGGVDSTDVTVTATDQTRTNQTITFPAIAAKTFGNPPFTVSATASSGLPVSFSIASGPATISGNTVTLTGAGTVVVQANQGGNATYNAAPAVSQNITVAKAAQTITFPAIASKVFGDAPFALSATSTSSLPVTYNVVSGPATISGNTVTLTGAGTVNIEAVQAGNQNYNAATNVSRSFSVAKANQTITFAALPSKSFGDAPFALTATASSGLPVTYSIVSGPATISGSTLTITGAGTVVVNAAQAGNTNYNAATSVSQNLAVQKANQTISFGSIPTKTFGDPPFALTATASSGLTVSYRVVSGPATLSGNIVSLAGTGTVIIEASQAGNANYNAATPLSQTFNVIATPKSDQVITFAALANKTFGDAPFSLSATASSGLSVTFNIVSGPATLSGNTLTITGAGTVVVEAEQDGNASFNPAPPVSRSFTVAKANQTISFAALTAKTFGDAPFALGATASSGLPVTYSIVSGPATVSGNMLTIIGAGTVVVSAAQAGNTNYNAATSVSQNLTVAKANQTISFGALTAKTFGDAPFTLSATASSSLPVTFSIVSGPATVSGNTLTITGAGTVVVSATQAGNVNYNAATAVSQNLTVQKASQVITFGAIPGKTFGDPPFAISGTSTSGLTVSFRIVSGPATLSGTTITLTGTGTVVVEATQAGNTNYNAASPVSQTFTVSTAAKTDQVITFAALAGKTFGDAPFTLSATASSGLPVSFSVTSGPATLSGNTVTLTGAGTVTIEATQGGNATFNPAPSVARTFTVAKANQVITFGALASKTFGDAPFALTATASSGLPVTFSIVSGLATLSGNSLTITGAGTVVVSASQAGNTNYNAAPSVSQNLIVSKASQSITFAALSSKTFGDAPFTLGATASSGLPVTYTIVSGPGTVSGNTLTITGAGTILISAAQTGNTNYNAATSVSQNQVVVKANQTIDFDPITSKTFGDPPFALDASASSGLAVSYRIVSGPATLSGNTLSLTGTGTVIVEASQAGNINYNSATAVSRSFSVNTAPKTDQVITFAALASKTFGDAPFVLSATASSGLPVSFSIFSGPATISGNTLTITGTGTVVVEAEQDGNSTFNPAPPVSRSFVVAKANQTISFGALPAKTFGEAPFALGGTASSGLPITYTIVSGPGTISGNIFIINGAGTVLISASQAGNTNYNAATSVSQSLTVAKGNQTIIFPTIGNKTVGDVPFALSATASSGLATAFRVVSGPATLSGVTLTLTGAGTVVVEASQAGNVNVNPAPPVSQSILVQAATTCSATGTILQEQWDNINGSQVADIPLLSAPTSTRDLTSLEGPLDIGEQYGSRIRGYICAPQTGNYVFTIAGDNAVELWLSTDDDPANKVYIAGFTGWTGFREWNKYSSQQSVPISLVAGRRYYIEALHKEEAGGDHVSVKWQMPNGVTEAPIPGTRLSPYYGAIVKANQSITFPAIPNKTYGDPGFNLGATASSGLPVVYSIVSGPAILSGSTLLVAGAGTVVVEASQPGNSVFNAATPVTQSFIISKANQTITFPALAPKTFLVDSQSDLNASSSSGFPVTYSIVSGNAIISGTSANIVWIMGAGTIVVSATQSGNGNYNPATATQNLVVAKAPQSISFPAIPDKAFGDAPFTLNASSSLSLPIAYRVISGPATISGAVVTISGAGTVVIEAAQAGNENIGAATPVLRTFNVTSSTKTNQVITFAAPASKTFGDPAFNLGATASSGLPVTFNLISGPATLTGNTITLTGAGTVMVEAAQAGDATYNPAPSVSRSFVVAKANQTISFGTLAVRTFGDAPVTLNATASSGLPVTYTVVSGPATVSGNSVTITGAGTVVISAAQPGNTNYNAATSITQNMTVQKSAQVITFAQIGDRTMGEPPFALSAIASSALNVSLRVVSGPATLSGSNISLTGTGTVVVEATQAGNTNYNAATPVSQSFLVQAAAACTASGTILHEQWDDVLGSQVSAIPLLTTPTSTRQLTSLEGPLNIRESYGARIRGYICAPQTGNYIFTIAGDNAVELWLSTDDNPANKVYIAGFTGWTGYREWNKYPEQQSLPINLVAGRRYYVEALHKEEAGGDNVSVKWVMPNGVTEAPIPGTRLSPYTGAVVKANQTITFPAIPAKTYTDPDFTLAAVSSSGLPVSYSVIFGSVLITNNTVEIIGTGNVMIQATQPGNAMFNPATPVVQSFVIEKASQTLNFPAIPTKTFGDPPFTLPAITSSGLIPTFFVVSGPAVLSGNTVTIMGAGTVVINAQQGGNGFYHPSNGVSQTLIVNKASQAISFPTIPAKVVGDAPFTVSAAATSGLPITYNIISGPATVSGNTVTITGAGIVNIQASQVGNTNFLPAAAVTQSFNVTSSAKTNQVITFAAPSAKTFGDAPFSLSASASSGLPVSFNIVSGPATLSGNTVTITGAGTITVEATQEGNATFNPAAAVSRSFNAAKANQTINFGVTAPKTFGDVPFALNGIASSGLPVSYTIASGPATISGNMLTITGAGTVVITATQAGNNNYNAATSVSANLTVLKANQTITFPAIGTKTLADAPFQLNATASSGLAAAFRVVSGPATLTGITLTLNGTGTVVVEASQPGNTNYNAATAVSQSFSVQPAPACSGSGTILQEQWDEVFGSQVAAIPVSTTPTSTRQLTSLEGPLDIRELYGSRIRGYVCAPQTGNYIFTIAGDNAAEVWLSTDDNPVNKQKIAGFTGWTGFRQWDKYPEQRSAAISLVAGQRYYIEVLHKEEAGGDHVSVKWQMPNGVTEAPIPGNRLSPYQPVIITSNMLNTQNNAMVPQNQADDKLTIYPNPVLDVIHLNWNGSYKGHAVLNMYDYMGRRVRSLKINKENPQYQYRLQVGDLQPGMYFLEIKTGDGKTLRRTTLKK